jgi:hypothetical protein
MSRKQRRAADNDLTKDVVDATNKLKLERKKREQINFLLNKLVSLEDRQVKVTYKLARLVAIREQTKSGLIVGGKENSERHELTPFINYLYSVQNRLGNEYNAYVQQLKFLEGVENAESSTDDKQAAEKEELKSKAS